LDGKGRKDNGKILTVPFTFILSCRGREEKQGKILKDPLTLPSPAKWRGKMKRNEFNEVPCSLPRGCVVIWF
jgi:hypothetical protein